MYSIKGTKDIEFNYNISSIRKISDTEYQYHGKPNSPNLVLSNGIKRISYVAERIEIKQEELIIHHSATSNFPNKAMVIFPLVVYEGRVTTIDRLLGMEMNETLDLDIGSEITDFTMEINETQKSAYIIRLSGGLPISKKPTIIEGACGLSGQEKADLTTALKHSEMKHSNPHIHKIDTSEFATLMNEYMENAERKCMHEGNHKIKLNGATTITTYNDENPSDYVELTDTECTEIGGTMGTPFAGVPGEFREGAGGQSPNQEMECFPNEGGVFNMKFHIIYDISGTEQFIAENGVKIKEKDNAGVSNNKTLREAMNAEVKNLKEHIEKLGGIYVPEAIINDKFSNVKNKNYKYIKSDELDTRSKEFFDENNEIDIFITYVADSTEKLRRFTGISKKEGDDMFTLDGEDALTKPHQAKESILVAVRQDGDEKSPLLMNAKKFSEDYLNKDFNRYTHISIPGYMTETENQSMKAIMSILALIFASLISYYTIPGFYKIAIERITGYSRDCERDGDAFGNYYLATAFNYSFTIITIVIPLIIIGIAGPNGVLYGLIACGIIFLLAIYARYTIDRMFFYRFYPRKRGQPCNKTKEFIESNDEGSRFKVFKYIPAAWSALTSRNISRK